MNDCLEQLLDQRHTLAERLIKIFESQTKEDAIMRLQSWMPIDAVERMADSLEESNEM